MYQVIVMYGDNEPWWFFEDWQADIKSEQLFVSFEEAKLAYEQLWFQFHAQYPCFKGYANYLCAFWDEKDLRFCEECDEDLQQYTGIAILQNYQPITKESERTFYETTNHCGKAKCCQRSQSRLKGKSET